MAPGSAWPAAVAGRQRASVGDAPTGHTKCGGLSPRPVRCAGEQDARIFRRLTTESVAPYAASARPSIACCISERSRTSSPRLTRLPISAFVRHFQIGQELTLEGCKHLNERHMDFDRSELCLGKTPGRFLESTLFCVFDLGQTDKPSLRRQQQTGRS